MKTLFVAQTQLRGPVIKMQGAVSPPKVKYSALFLDENNPLKQIAIPSGWKQYADHCTLEFGPTENRFPVLQGTLKVSELRQTSEVLYAVAEPPAPVLDWVRQHGITNIPYHITIATAPGISPKRAKEVQEQALQQPGSVPFIAVTPYNADLPFTAGGFIENSVIFHPQDIPSA